MLWDSLDNRILQRGESRTTYRVPVPDDPRITWPCATLENHEKSNDIWDAPCRLCLIFTSFCVPQTCHFTWDHDLVRMKLFPTFVTQALWRSANCQGSCSNTKGCNAAADQGFSHEGITLKTSRKLQHIDHCTFLYEGIYIICFSYI